MTMDVRAQAEAVAGTADLARLLRGLRQRLARGGSPLSYRQIAARTGISSGAVGIYLTGARLPAQERFTALVDVLGADLTERAALTAAWQRLAVAAEIVASWPDGTTTPQGLPAQPAAFTGRAHHLVRLDDLVEPETRPARLAVITGMAGVGKTALALHWAHRAARHFPDGQIYVDLHAYSSGTPLSIMDTLGVLLTALGVELDGLADLTTRALRYQTLLQGRSMLVVLDNVSSVEHVTGLLPPPPCVTIVTSRDQLAEIDATLRASRLELTGLSEPEMMDLLRRLVGPRVDQEPQAAQALATRCAYLPLALRIAAEHAAARPRSTLLELVAELEEDDNGLDEFEVPSDPRADLRSVFSWSLHRLPPPLARAFRLLGLLPGLDLDRYAMAALVGVDPAEADELAFGLVEAHLLETRRTDRFAMHDLLRAFARIAAQRELEAQERQLATTRLLDYYLSAATAAGHTVFPADDRTLRRDRSVPTSTPHIPDLTELGTAAAWFGTERPNLVAACVHAANHGWPAHAVATAVQIWVFLEEAHAHDALIVHTAAVAAAEVPGAASDRDKAHLLAALGLAHFRLGNLDQAGEWVEQSIAMSDEDGDEDESRLSRTILAFVRSAQGRYVDAFAALERVLETSRGKGPAAEIVPLINMGEISLTLERYEAAADYYRRAASLGATPELRQVFAEAHRGAAEALVLLGNAAEAVPIAEQAVEVTRHWGYPIRLVLMLDTLARAYQACGRTGDAIERLTEALELCREQTGYPVAQVLNTLGEIHLEAGDHRAAKVSHGDALDEAERANDRKERARASTGLGDAYAALGDLERARQCWQAAIEEYTDMGLPTAARVQDRLDNA